MSGSRIEAAEAGGRRESGGRVKCSILILTRNEEACLRECLASVGWSDDVVVFDSFSDDATERIAREGGALFIRRAFDDYASQRNAALDGVAFRHPWVFVLDADERVSPELGEEISEFVVSVDRDVSLGFVRRKDYFMGRWLKRSSGYPTWFGRLVRVGRVKVRRRINEEYVTSDRVAFLKGHLVHLPFQKGLAHWYERHNRYSSAEAELFEEERALRGRNRIRRWSDPVERRKAIKGLSYSLPFRPVLTWLYLVVLRLGILDGTPGVLYAGLRASYELMIDVKRRELRRSTAGLPV